MACHTDINDILRDYESHFADGLADGRSEDEVAAALGEPSRLARELRAEAGFRRWEENRNAGNFVGVVLALLGLATIDFIILLPLLCIMAAIFFGLSVACLGLVVGGSFLLFNLLWGERDRDVTITLPGRAFEKFILTGTGKMNLNGLNQEKLTINMAGVATITANGKVDDLNIKMAGVSKADFGQVTGRKTKIQMAGVNKADIAPSEEADVNIAGPSEVTLHSNPPKLDTHIMGPGRLHKVSP